MAACWRARAVLLAAALVWACAATAARPATRPVRVAVRSDFDVDVIARFADVDHYFAARGYATAYATEGARRELAARGFDVVDDPVPVHPEDEGRVSKRSDNEWDRHHTHSQFIEMFEDLVRQYPNITRLHTIGYSTLGKPIVALRVTDNPDVREPREAGVKLVGNMHGDEVVGRELIIRLAHHLAQNYGSSPDVRNLVDNLDIWLVPTVNPDGYEARMRENKNNVDLNRDFPDQYLKDPDTFAGRQPETVAYMNFTRLHHWVLSAGMHGGAVVANYPFDANANRKSGVYSASEDDAVFRMLAGVYAQAHSFMSRSREFRGGIVNGAQWYVLFRGAQDWNYVFNDGVYDITLELSESKWPPASAIGREWEYNSRALLDYLSVPLRLGVSGVVVDAATQLPVTAARINVSQGRPVRADPETGSYWKILVPGTYKMTVTAPGYIPWVGNVEIPTAQKSSVVLDVQMSKEGTTNVREDVSGMLSGVTFHGGPLAKGPLVMVCLLGVAVTAAIVVGIRRIRRSNGRSGLTTIA
eukprot:m51a1_g6618 putative carboxypeptidase d (529) ;mRNA; r:41334-43158